MTLLRIIILLSKACETGTVLGKNAVTVGQLSFQFLSPHTWVFTTENSVNFTRSQ